MKKGSKMCLIVAAIFFLFCGSAMAVTYTYNDNTDSFPGYTPAGFDEYGGPKITSMEITINDNTNDLMSVVVNLTDRRLFDSLFINTGGAGPYEAWDFYVKDYWEAGYPKFYAVAAQYDYQTATEAGHPYPRPDHPVGFDSGITEVANILQSVVYNGSAVIYSFDSGIVMQPGFVVGYTAWCANDVILTPEPMSLLLLGLGLIGVAGIRRKF